MKTQPLPTLLALALAAFNVGLVGGALVLDELNGSRSTYDSPWADLLPALSFTLVAALVLVYRPNHVIGWLLLLIGFLLVIEPFGFSYATYTLLVRPGSLPAGWLVLLIAMNGWGLGYGVLVWLVLLFPTGRLLSRRWAWLGFLATMGTTLWAILTGIATWTFGEDLLLQNVPPGAETLQQWGITILGVVTLAFLGALISLIVRLRRSSGVERQQLKWFVYAAALATSVMLILILMQDDRDTMVFDIIGITFYALAFSAVPIAIGIAILRYRLWDIDPLINRTLVYGMLTASIIGLYALIVGGVGTLFHGQGSFFLSILATGVAAVLFEPLRTRLQRAVNRLMYGERDDPYAVISRLGQRLETSLAPDTVLTTIVTTVKETLKLPYAAIALDQEDNCSTLVAAAGTPVSDPFNLPLSYHGETMGHLFLGPRAPGEAFTPAEHRLLADLARQAGAAAHAVRLTTDLQRLTADLQRSRERLVAAREEERRRLRRDLHDGLGPQLASHTLKLEAARDLVRANPERAEALLSQLIEKSQGLIGEIRRLVYALRPPALDELGLIGAVQEYAAQSELNGLRITLATPEHLPPLPAAVEVAAYRIVQEALTNVIRHAGAQHCTIKLIMTADRRPQTADIFPQSAVGGQRSSVSGLSLEITDDGIGLPPERHPGIGLTSMRERAGELGGECVVEALPGGGTRVWAALPLTQE
ncbi:MAG: sensor histidine kinase [Anaerolineales bacterium]|nr:sensor histidine kinase [Anaerolineales bacterium]